MMEILNQIRDVVQEDPGKRGLRSDPEENLITACAGDFAGACAELAATKSASLAVVTGFFIPTGTPPAGETDGPLGALFLARALAPLGMRVVLVSDAHSTGALQAGVEKCGLEKDVSVITLPDRVAAEKMGQTQYCELFRQQAGPLTHLAALERVGPGHGPDREKCHSMRGIDITSLTSPAHWLFEVGKVRTVGIGDGGNEIGMGKIPRAVIARNIARGEQIACRVATDHLLVCGISNWGAYALGAGVRLLRKAPWDEFLFDEERERELLEIMVRVGPLIDGVSGKPTVSVDGLEFDRYCEPLRRIGELVRNVK